MKKKYKIFVTVYDQEGDPIDSFKEWFSCDHVPTKEEAAGRLRLSSLEKVVMIQEFND